MAINMEMKTNIAKLIAEQITSYRAIRDKDLGKVPEIMTMAEIAQCTLEDFDRKRKGVFNRLDIEVIQIRGIMKCIDTLGGRELAIEISDILEQFDEQEETLSSKECQHYATNFSRLATGVITGWVD